MSFLAPPVVAQGTEWSQTTVESGESATVELDLPEGGWNLSLQYDATREVVLTAGDRSTTVPGNLDYRGTAPYWPVPGLMLPGPRTVELTATVERPAARRPPPRRQRGRAPRIDRRDPRRALATSCARLRRLVRALMDLGFGEALLIFGALLAVTAALSGLIRGTVLSASVLSIVLGIVLAELDLVSVDVGERRRRRADPARADPDADLRRAAGRPRAPRPALGSGRAGARASPCRSPCSSWRWAPSCCSPSSHGPSRSCSAPCSAPPTRWSPPRWSPRSGCRLDPPHAQPRIGPQRRSRAAVRALLPRPRLARRRRRPRGDRAGGRGGVRRGCRGRPSACSAAGSTRSSREA